MDDTDAWPEEADAKTGSAFDNVQIEITVAVGRTRPALRDLLRMGQDAVLTLDRRVDDPVELFVGDRLVARGELQELEGDQAGQLAVRLTEVADVTSEL
ncbi:flagellar motor switch protein FliN/FliY [Tranquillimonas rosea]|uniref:Flagellar motor switch protein FliN/FliY n=1 Tax=Tranquillimonas rosea TaxID=641238 RepID=A0A1H9UCN0_9RHOB|nr:FliM/FliN family flagellar motor switch protein [Tranquillimonas rosea]SES07011.1 flagellar motor switch protein FliN/FliY [Tranquillimonas rosea]